jgi:hypothetical protein
MGGKGSGRKPALLDEKGLSLVNSDVKKQLEKVGAKDKLVLEELWGIAKKKVRTVYSSDKLKALELIMKLKGWLREGDVIQQNTLITLLAKSGDEIKRLIDEDKIVSEEVESDVQDEAGRDNIGG